MANVSRLYFRSRLILSNKMSDSTVCYLSYPSSDSNHARLSINLPPHLRNLIIRASIIYYSSDDDGFDYYQSFLPTAIEILKSATSLHCITLEVNVDFSDGDCAVFDDIDLSSLTDLADSMSFRRIDLHFNFDRDFEPSNLTSRLANDLGLAELMEQGVLVVHLNERVPVFDTDR